MAETWRPINDALKDEERCLGLSGRCALAAGHRGQHQMGGGVSPVARSGPAPSRPKVKRDVRATVATARAKLALVKRYAEEYAELLRAERVKLGLPPEAEPKTASQRAALMEENARLKALLAKHKIKADA